jgi:hypothetical protein
LEAVETVSVTLAVTVAVEEGHDWARDRHVIPNHNPNQTLTLTLTGSEVSSG